MLRDFLVKLEDDTLILPTLPDVAIEIQSVVNRPSSSLKQVVAVVCKDTAISARIIKVANSAMFYRGSAANSLMTAVTRIGLTQIQSLVISAAAEQLFISSNEIVGELLDDIWERSVDVTSAACALLLIYKKEHPHFRINLDTLSLAGLVYNIGALPLLMEAENRSDQISDIDTLQLIIEKLQTPVGVALLKHWEFSEDIIEVVEHWHDLEYQSDDVTCVDFVRAAAIYTKNLKINDKTSNHMAILRQKGLPLDNEELASSEFLAQYRSIKQSYE
ncbi:HDOD domain-containing protein [Parashewanella spongiae]|uniref:HDOD domain-containing protein n=2 Tax=Parashewanella spongiae TaxID=342950 RepID=A0A3A6T864_9GAMM|nr:HDOD domain-containing protein [Parashewanella spongiae]MCL1078827.1 HDOD domain-containing protein [Parashewanella spongiae]RJY10665.1 HDOD domain-containing protein [Parashewanella spongiae]